MKLVYLANSLIPSRTANSIHVMKMCQAFAHNHHQVTLLTPNYPDIEVGVKNVYEFYGIENCFAVEKLPWLPLKGRVYFSGLLAALKAQTLQPDLVYGRCLHSCFFSSFLGQKVRYEAHLLPNKTSRISVQMLDYLLHSPNLDKLVVISKALKTAFQEKYGLDEAKILVAHDGADPPIHQSTSSPLVDLGGQLRVGYLGHLYPGKGMEIIAQLVPACPWAEFHIIGGTETDLNYWQSQLKKFQNIHFYGFVPPAECEAYRQACDVLIAPYLRQVANCGGGDIAQWMSPLKIFEYMAAAKAIITSDLPVLREVLSHELTALLYPPEDLTGWSEGLIYLRDYPEVRESLGKQAKQEFDTYYTWQARAEKVISDAIT